MTSTTFTMPQQEGEWTPDEAKAWHDILLKDVPNLAGREDVKRQATKLATSIIGDWSEYMQGLWRRWRGTWHMLQGNTLERGGPEDVHSPELYKQMETIIPRAEEQMLEREPWFRIISRKRSDRDQVAALEAYMDWLFSQAKFRMLVEPALRDMLVCQKAAFYVTWENRKAMRTTRTVERKLNYESGKIDRKVKVERKEEVVFSGTKYNLIDPVDFLIDRKATNPQEAVFVGHRAWLTIDEIRQLAPIHGWVNVDELDDDAVGKTLGPQMDQYTWGRDPTARYGSQQDRLQKRDQRPGKIEVVFLHTRATFDEGKTYKDYRITIAGGSVVMDVRENPEDFRPYATWRVTKSGHEFYGTGIFDNTLRLNQHLDRFLQTIARGSAVAAQPIVFADEDSDLPDSLYKVTPFKVYKGTGNVRFTQIPDGFLRSAPLMISLWQRNIEETSGSFRIQMGQQDGGTATEATLALQEGNRRMRGIIRSMADGLEQILDLTYRYICKYSTEDVEFPVLGKRAIDMRKTHLTVGPADLLDDVKFELVGLRSARNYGLKATGLKAFTDSMAPFIMANPQSVDQVAIMHEFASEFLGPDEADRLVKVPTSLNKLKSQDDENEGLMQGAEIEVDPDDNDEEHVQSIAPLFQIAIQQDCPWHPEVRRVVIQHMLDHMQQLRQKEAQKQAIENRKPIQQALTPAEAGGQPAADGGMGSPQRGGFGNDMMSLLNEPPGQTQGENPGPASASKFSRTGRQSKNVEQTGNTMMGNR